MNKTLYVIENTSTGAVGQFCGTSYAAKLLGVSIGTILKLVENGSLQGWKTDGGHRRISIQSIQDYQSAHNLTSNSLFSSGGRLRVLVVEDDESTRVMYQAYFDKWNLPLDVVIYASAMEAMLDMVVVQPHVLVTDLRMPKMDGFEFIKILKQHKLFSNLPIIAISGLSKEKILHNGGIPQDVQLLEKPVDMVWLRGFFDALISINGVASE
jgi:excisionase family DNA binding protein